MLPLVFSKNLCYNIYILKRGVYSMAKKMCKCAICGIEFDRNTIQAVRHGARRYSHQTCEPDGELVPMEGDAADPDLVKLMEYTQNLLGKDYNPARVKKQVKDFKEEYKYSYSGMLKSLIYFYEVKGNSKEKANGGIGIVPFVYNDAYNYYLGLFMAGQANINKDVVSFTSKVKEITIKPPVADMPKHYFDFLEDDNEQE